MGDTQKASSEKLEMNAIDVEFLPLSVLHKIHRNIRSSQVEIVPMPYYVSEPTPEPEIEVELEAEPESMPPPVVYAPPLPALKEKNNWWDFYQPVYAFNNPIIRSRLEKLMSTNIVYVTDRKYMITLQERIKEDHLNCLYKRIQEREADEIEREKGLLLEGKIPYEEAPKELKEHPVCRINQIAKSIMENKKAKLKFYDKTWAYRTSAKRIKEAEKTLRETVFEKEIEPEDERQTSAAVCMVDAELSEDIAKGFMYSQEDYDMLKYENPLIKLLREIEGVQDMYEIADQIIGSFKLEMKPKGIINGQLQTVCDCPLMMPLAVIKGKTSEMSSSNRSKICYNEVNVRKKKRLSDFHESF